jgi:uncharacterized protein YdeI (YjbR/CyaY-like superfamily)
MPKHSNNTIKLPEIAAYFEKDLQWKTELLALRNIVLATGLIETYKWKVPIYTYNGANIVGLNGFKEAAVLSFFKGSLIEDTEKKLIQPGENSTASRMMKFTSVAAILALENSITSYLYQAIEIEKAGLKVAYPAPSEMQMPEELAQKLAEDPTFKLAFEALTPGRQKGYIIHFAGAKQAATRRHRIEECTAKILKGKGFFDCTCGLSKKMPSCDGSHKYIGQKGRH